jgi:ATP-dependent helicase/DNAse subunit B
MKFYLSSVCSIRVEPDPEDGIDARLMGTIFHNSAERVYKEIMSHTGSNVITREHLSAYTTDKGSRLQKIIDEQFQADAGITEFRGENILIRGVVERYLMNLLRWDECHAPITMEAMEEDVNMQMDVDVDGQKVSVLTGGRVDRMDMLHDEKATLTCAYWTTRPVRTRIRQRTSMPSSHETTPMQDTISRPSSMPWQQSTRSSLPCP